jgi:hypothetical protein
MKTLHTKTQQRRKTAMTETATLLDKLNHEFTKFETTMEELYMLKRVANDLKSYRKMIKLKKYD